MKMRTTVIAVLVSMSSVEKAQMNAAQVPDTMVRLSMLNFVGRIFFPVVHGILLFDLASN
ncbi:MAG: hypothetical protein UX89_C0010G0001 [Parcubacteria group bacterium GW2011_GWA2_47_16]|nr:MAG: hypothetical protein UX89_C0010G0001 [Parcubacteria group bacterium GW2011_GWA2_47_16]